MRSSSFSGDGFRGAWAAMLLVLAGATATAWADDRAAETAANRQIAVEFFELALVEKRPREAFAKYAAERYIQHNPVAADGHEPAIRFLTDWFAKNPRASIEIKRVIAEGDLVAIHHHMRTSPEDRGAAAVDIFRVENGKVAEHWDVVQRMPEKSANPHPMF